MGRDIVMQGLLARGIPRHIAEGIAGNIAVESGFDPGINEKNPTVAGSRGGFGLFQHTGPRRRALEAFAANTGRPVNDVNTQLDFALQELQTTERSAGQALSKAKTAEEAARIFSEKFLRPGTPHLDRRIAAATGQANAVGGQGTDTLLGNTGGQQMANGEHRGGLLGGLLSPDKRDRLILGLEGMTLNPNKGLQQAALSGIQSRVKKRATQQQANKTAAFLRQRGREDLAAAVESGAIDARAAVQSALAQTAPTKGVEINGQLVNPVTGERIGDFRTPDTPKPTTRIVSGADASALGLDPSKSYNLTEGPSGTKATEIGGGGTTVNLGDGETAFSKKTGQLLATEANDIAKQGASAQRNLGRIITLRQALNSSPQGIGGALTKAAGSLGIKTEGSSNIEVANAIISQLVPEQRAPGSGTMSDADLALFKSSLPQLINTPEGNKKIIDTMEAISQYDVQRGNIARRQQVGEINAQQAFDEYAKLGNPLADFVAPTSQAATSGRSAGVATHRFNPATGKVEAIK